MSGSQPLPPPPAHLTRPPAGPGMSKGTKVLLWSLGGCAVIAVLLVVGMFALAGAAFMHNFNVRTSVAAPVDFPVYPGAQQTAAFGIASKSGIGRGANLVQWQVRTGGGGKVAAWYRQHLNEGDWELLDTLPSGRLLFRRRSTGAEARLMVQDELVQTVIQLTMTDDQPLQPGAHPDPLESQPAG